MSRRKLGRRRGRGSTIVEFAVTFPLFILAMAGLFQFGYAFLIYNNLQTAVRAGGRYAALADYDLPGGTDYKTRVKNVVVYGVLNPDPNVDKAAAPGLTPEHVTVDDSDKDGNGFLQSVRVSINNYEIFAVWDEFVLLNKPASLFVYQGQFN